LGGDTPIPSAKRRRVERAAAEDGEADEDDNDDEEDSDGEMEDAEEEEDSELESNEARVFEEAKAAVIKHMKKELGAQMRNTSFDEFAYRREFKRWDGKVWLILTDPPYNTQRVDAGADLDMPYDVLTDAQIKLAADLFKRLLAPGG
jgi:hypothetical protein